MKVTRIGNAEIEEVLLGVPSGHRHLRAAIKTAVGTFLFQEAALAGLLRAFVTVKTHPLTRALRLVRRRPSGVKRGFDPDQLLEEEMDEEEIEAELARLLEE